ncbi:hypothetical protein DPEC_G00259530 [Dallia pectoralis]|uniref:Uncharacterized protein n=1 Tax=Dallia pectoralis TaxID=75939 RepID=A0ACC2FR91_DALPE|nr:hypothetical protein DPEC_G00259530 [Dallia pectoralis]
MHVNRCCYMFLITCSVFLNASCLESGTKPPCPIISELWANVAMQTLELRWLVNHTAVDTFEIQVGRTAKFIVVHNTNVSHSNVSSNSVLTWSWVSTLPLQCADHSVRIRSFCNHSNPSDWTQWKTYHGTQEEVDRIKKTTTMYPFQQVLKEGSTILFCCVPPKGVDITNMTFNETSYPMINITDRVRAIAVHNLNITRASGSGVYFRCEDTEEKNKHCSNFISFSPERPEDLTCSTEDLRDITCTWTPGRPANLFKPYRRTHTLYVENSGQHPVKCDESSCRLQTVPGLERYQVSVVVRNQLGEERQRYSFNITDRVFPVPEEVRVSPGVDKANVSWVLRGNLSGLGIFCQVTADPINAQQRPLMQQVCHGALENQCNVSLENLLPNTRYAIRVCCAVKANPVGKWTQLGIFTTNPLVTLDAWRRVVELSHDRRNVTLLWTLQISGSASIVRIQHYWVSWSQNGSQWIQQRGKMQTQTEISIGPGKCDIIIQAVIRTGSSLPAHINILPAERGSRQIVMLMAESASGGFHLFWEDQEDATCGYTVEWCTQGSSVPCNLQWRRVPMGKTWMFLQAGNFTPGRRYTFDIYGCTDKGDKLLAIRTGYSQELRPAQSPKLVEPIVMSSASVTLDWDYDENNPSNPGFITGYLVTVYKVPSTGHAHSPFNKTVVDPHKKTITIVGLQDNQEYTFHLSALTKIGPGPRTIVIVRTQEIHKSNTAWRTFDSTLLAQTFTPFFLLLGLFIIMWPFCKMLKSHLMDVFRYPAGMNINVLELDHDLLETSERLWCLREKDCVCSNIEIINISQTRPLVDSSYLLPPVTFH